MKVLVTGATGFVGGWLARELESSGHTVVAAPRGPRSDLWNTAVVRELLIQVMPDAVAHLAAVSFAPDATNDPALALRTNAGGTQAVIEALRTIDRRTCLLVTGSSEVYGRQDPERLPIREDAPLRATSVYGLSKLAQEAIAVTGAIRHGIPTAVTRPFNHIGPGQRPVFAAPGFANRVIDVKAGRANSIRAGNVDVKRDLADVRDVVVAYRLLLELLHDGGTTNPLVVNVATGSSVSMRDVIVELCRVARVEAPIEVDAGLVRDDDPPDIRGDATLLSHLTDWHPQRELRDTLRDLLASLSE